MSGDADIRPHAVERRPIEPHPIEVASYRILDERIDLSAWPAGQRDVVARMIHSTADLTFADTARIGPDAVLAAVAALASGAPVIVDAAMVAAGTPRIDTTCLLDQVPVAPPGSTRSAAAFELAAERHPSGAVWVVGNAPTALFALLELHTRGLAEPAAVVGVPVGFVGAAESKAALWDSALMPVTITCLGERGGTPVAAGALNALWRLSRSKEPPC
jgi:precorrin-8X/cobalt-precorrin-8 methylmutase